MVDNGISRSENLPEAFEESKEISIGKSQTMAEMICNGCQSEIKGIRYKCSVCENFDFCENCEE